LEQLLTTTTNSLIKKQQQRNTLRTQQPRTIVAGALRHQSTATAITK
jgi:hypothetical protein